MKNKITCRFPTWAQIIEARADGPWNRVDNAVDDIIRLIRKGAVSGEFECYNESLVDRVGIAFAESIDLRIHLRFEDASDDWNGPKCHWRITKR